VGLEYDGVRAPHLPGEDLTLPLLSYQRPEPRGEVSWVNRLVVDRYAAREGERVVVEQLRCTGRLYVPAGGDVGEVL
jgi:hypothetical protein